eukprot:COSAG02_NODE_37970_length_435_cov_0.705357_1_plen_69_part_01
MGIVFFGAFFLSIVFAILVASGVEREDAVLVVGAAVTIGLLIMGGYAYFGVWKPWKQKEPERREAARVL